MYVHGRIIVVKKINSFLYNVDVNSNIGNKYYK